MTGGDPGRFPTPRADQFSGCLIGQCLGDALGFPVEGYGPAVCRRYVIHTAITVGGDADTTAAMAGASRHSADGTADANQRYES